MSMSDWSQTELILSAASVLRTGVNSDRGRSDFLAEVGGLCSGLRESAGNGAACGIDSIVFSGAKGSGGIPMSYKSWAPGGRVVEV